MSDPRKKANRVTKGPGVRGDAPKHLTSFKRGHELREQTRYRWPSGSIGHRDGQMAVVAEHKKIALRVVPEKVGKSDPSDPLEGRLRPGIARVGQKDRKDSEPANCLNASPTTSVRGSSAMRP